MAVYKRDMVDINLETGNIHRSFLKHSIGYKDAAADHFGIRVFRNGEPVNLTGVSVQGIFMPPQGSPIAITSGNIVSENEAEVVLPQACYNYDGQFTLSIKLVDATNAVTGTMRIVDGMVDNTHASGTVAPTSAVPTYQEVLSAYEQAIAVIGNSVRFDQSQSLTDTQKGTARTNIAAASESELSDVKSALVNLPDYVEPYQIFNNRVLTNNGQIGTFNGYKVAVCKMEKNKAYKIVKVNGVNAQDGTRIGYSNTLYDGSTTIVVSYINTDENEIVFYNSEYDYLYYNYESTNESFGVYKTFSYISYDEEFSKLNNRCRFAKNIFDKTDITAGGYYDSSNVWHTNNDYVSSGYIPVEEGHNYRASTWYKGNYITSGAFYDSNKEYIEGFPYRLVYGYVTAPENAAFMRVPIQKTALATFVMAEGTDIIPSGIPYNQTAIIENYTKAYKADKQYELLTKYSTGDGVLKTDGTTAIVSTVKHDKYKVFTDKVYLYGTVNYTLGNSFAILWFVKNGSMDSYIEPKVALETFDCYELTIPEGVTEIWCATQLSLKVLTSIDVLLRKRFEDAGTGEQWAGKKWFSYGTSITTDQYGHWAGITADALGINLSNKGIGGGGLVTNHQVYDAIMDLTDGKTDADLITIEFGPNDRNATLGDIDSLENSTIFGALNLCIKEIAENCPKAQIVIMPSLPNRYEAGTPSVKFPLNYTAPGGWTRDEFFEGAKRLAQLNCVHYCPFGSEYAIPYFRAQLNNTYIGDQIHPTALGGYNIAQEMIQYIKKIPVWFTSIP